MRAPSRFMQGIITVVLLLYFGLAMFGESVWPGLTVSEALTQTLINLVIAVVMFYVGSSSGSQKKDDTIAGLSGSGPTDSEGRPEVVATGNVDSTPVPVSVESVSAPPKMGRMP